MVNTGKAAVLAHSWAIRANCSSQDVYSGEEGIGKFCHGVGHHPYKLLTGNNNNHISQGCHIRDTPKQRFLNILGQPGQLFILRHLSKGKKRIGKCGHGVVTIHTLYLRYHPLTIQVWDATVLINWSQFFVSRCLSEGKKGWSNVAMEWARTHFN